MAGTNELIVLDSRLMVRPFGLHNTGVVCHFNSLVQMLLSCTSLTETVLNKNVRTDGNELIKMYANLVHQKPEWSIALFQTLIKEMRNRKRTESFGNLQESASEGLTLLLDMMNSPKIYSLFYHRYEYKIACMHCSKIVSNVTDYEVHFEFFLEANASYPTTANQFVNHIRRHTSEIDEYTCEQCNVKAVNVTRVHSLKMLPEILIILFNKYKNKRLIWYPPEMTFPGKGGTGLTYKLVGKVEHSGTLNGGHYTAVGLRNSGFHQFNDNQVTPINEITPTSNTYLIAYHFLEPSPVSRQ
jgi:ubiquitin C-terminal hydrolase